MRLKGIACKLLRLIREGPGQVLVAQLTNGLKRIAKRIFSRKFWLEAFFPAAIGGVVFAGVWLLREKQLFIGVELYHHDQFHLAQNLDFAKPRFATNFPWLSFDIRIDSANTNRVNTRTNLVVAEGTEKDVRRFGWPLEDYTLADILERLASFEPRAILLDIYRDMPVPKSGTQIKKLASVLTNNPEIICIRQIDLEDPEMTIDPPNVLMDDPARIGENSFPADDDTTIRRGILYMNDTEGGTHMSVSFQMANRILPDGWIGSAPSPLLSAYIPLADLGITNGQTLRLAAYQEGSSDDWSIDWTESVSVTIVSTNTPVAEISDSKDMQDPHGDLQRVSVEVAEEVMTLQMEAGGIVLPVPDGMDGETINRYYYHWLLDLDNDPATGFNNSTYEGAKTGIRNPIGADVIIEVGWREGAYDGIMAYQPGKEDKPLFENFYVTGSNPAHPFRFKIGKAIYDKLDSGEGPYVGKELEGYTYPFDYRGARGEEFSAFTMADVMGYLFIEADINKLQAFAAKLNQPTNAISAYLNGKLPQTTRQQLADFDDSNLDDAAMSLRQSLNMIIQGSSIYDTQRFNDVVLRPETKQMLDESPQGEALVRLNRMLLEDAYPLEIAKNQVLNKAEKKDFQGKLVFFGAVAQSLKDYYSLPHNPKEYLLYAHAMATDQLLRAYYNGDTLTRYWPRWWENLWIAFWSFMGVMMGFMVRNNPGSRLLILGPVLFAALFISAFVAFFAYQLWVPLIPPALSAGMSLVSMVFYLFLTEGRQKRAISGMFSTMVSPEVLKYLQEDPDNFRLAGDRKSATIFFSDVAGFTTIAEQLSAGDVAKVLNEYLTPLSDIIIRYGGYIDKYMGDAIMADFGVPVWNDPDPNSHAWKCCWAALEQQEEINRLQPVLQAKYGVTIQARMGINTGFVSAGNMGSTQKMQYTVMGDAVNQAARFEPANKIFGSVMMIGENTYQMARETIEVRYLGLLQAKGKHKSVKVYELLGKKGELDEAKQRLAAKFEFAWTLYAERNFNAARKAFEECLDIVPEDPPSKVFIAQCELLAQTPPSPEWKGEWIQLSK